MRAIPYSRQEVTEEDIEAIVATLRSDFLTQGPTVPAFEAAFAARHDVAHAVAVSNATAGLHIACLALDIGPGKRVWTSPNSFVASANCALYCGASIDFVDIDAASRNMSVDALTQKLEAAKATETLPHLVIPVHFSGLPCDLAEIRMLADRYGFKILEDASHATGASYRGHPIGSAWADATVFSFHAVKVITTAEGGMVTTQNATTAARLRRLRSHGITRESGELRHPTEDPWIYEQQSLGYNFRLSDIQAALGHSQLRRLDDMQQRRLAIADRYDRLLEQLPLRLPMRANDRTSAWHLYAVEIDDTRCNRQRADVFAAMRAAGIGVNVHYIPIHTQPYYEALGFRAGDFQRAEKYYAQTLSLPLFPALSAEEQQHVAATLRAALTQR